MEDTNSKSVEFSCPAPNAEAVFIALYDTQEAAPVQDFCRNQRFVCRMAKKLGCQICAKK